MAPVHLRKTTRINAALSTLACALACAACASEEDGAAGADNSGGSVSAAGSSSATTAATSTSSGVPSSPGTGGPGASGNASGDAVRPGNTSAGSMSPEAMSTGTSATPSMTSQNAMPDRAQQPPAGAAVDDGSAAGDTGAVDDEGSADGGGANHASGDGGASGSASDTPEQDSDAGAPGQGAESEPFDGKELFILIGQSNMSGMSPMPSEPWPINERVTFMVQFDCEQLGQTAGQWLPAEPPLHGCQWATNGIGLGLGDFFGAKLAEEWPDSNIGLVPNAVPGQLISIYLKEGGTQAPVAPYENAYAMTVERSMKAQEEGRIRAILLHQGESDDNQMMSEQWLGRVATVIADLRADLNLGEEVPLLAGQIGPSQWEKHNAYVDQIPDYVPNSAVITSEGTAIHDIAHFDEASAKIMGERYVEKFLEMVPQP